MNRKIGYELRILSNMIRRTIDKGEAVETSNRLTGTHGWVLGYLYENSHRDIFQRDLEEVCKIRRSSATIMLQKMENSGLITRSAVSNDGRLKKIYLTTAGSAMHEEVAKEILKMENDISRDITEDEMTIFFKVIDQIKKNLE